MVKWVKLKIYVLLPMSYERLDDEEEVKMISAYNENNNNYYNVITNSESNDEVEENLFEGQVEDKIKVTPKTTINPKVLYKWWKVYKLCIMKVLKICALSNLRKKFKGKFKFYNWSSYYCHVSQGHQVNQRWTPDIQQSLESS